MTDNEIENFKKEVRGQYLAIKNAREGENGIKEILESKRRPAGMINGFFFNWAVALGRIGVSLAQKKRGLAQKLLSNEKIGNKVCEQWRSTAAIQMDDDSRLVDCLVRVLSDRAIVAEFSVDLDGELFGACCDEISRVGFDRFCSK